MFKKINKKNSGQVSMEFIVSVIMILIIFLFGLIIFQDRSDYNSLKFINWESELIANRIARNINNVYLSDENIFILDYIYWDNKNYKVLVFDSTVSVFHDFGYADVPIFANVDLRVEDFNGPVIFEKKDNLVIVRYP
ncbi:MAG TPA: hypothetical protein PKK60_01710 [archaeon]|nr:hypothetical protein [archaeon]